MKDNEQNAFVQPTKFDARIETIEQKTSDLIDVLKKLEGRQVAMLDQQELSVLRMFMDQGRKQGLLVEFDTDTDEQAWAEMNSTRALEILAAANSYVRLRFT